MTEQTSQDWLKEAERKFGKNKGAIAFICPKCNNVQTLSEFVEKNLDHNLAYQECIGRHVADKGCNWAAYGFLGTLGNGRIVTRDDGGKQEVFDFAPATAKEVDSDDGAVTTDPPTEA